MAVTARTLRLIDGLRRQIDDIVDATTRDLVGAWATAWDEVAPDLQAALGELLTTPGERITRSQMLRSQRLMQALAVIADQLGGLADQAGVRITADLDALVETAGAAQASVIDSQLPPGSGLVDAQGWDRVDVRQIAAIVRRSTEQITSDLDPLPDDVMDVVRREVIRGMATGSNPRETARRMVDRVEGHVNGRWGLSRALVIARTEQVDAAREAARVAQMADENADVLTKWEWSCRLDARSCRACWGMHGSTYPVAVPGPLGHQQCRCARLPRTASWAELGFTDIEEPPDLAPDADEAFDALAPAEQRDLLGREGHKAWLAGDFPREEWAKRRETTGWRDSYVPAKPDGSGSGSDSGNGTGGTGQGEPPEGGRFNVSDALDTSNVTDPELRTAVSEALSTIDSLHGVDIAGSVDVHQVARPSEQRGAYVIEPGASAQQLEVNLNGTTPLATIVHELGHFLDHQVLGSDTGPGSLTMASRVDVNTLLGDWQAAVVGSRMYTTLVAMRLYHQHAGEPGHLPWGVVQDESGNLSGVVPPLDHVEYVMTPAELFARSYAQWVALRAEADQIMNQIHDVPDLLAEGGLTLVAGRDPTPPDSWQADDFEAVAVALDALFGSLGLLRRDP